MLFMALYLKKYFHLKSEILSRNSKSTKLLSKCLGEDYSIFLSFFYKKEEILQWKSAK